MRKVMFGLCMFMMALVSASSASADNNLVVVHHTYGDEDGGGTGLTPGDYFDWRAVTRDPNDGYTDQWACGQDVVGDFCVTSWQLDGFAMKIKSAELTIVHGGYLGGALYLQTADGRSFFIGNLTPSQVGNQNFLVQDIYNLKRLRKELQDEFIKVVLEVPLQGGVFAVDSGVVDFVQIGAWGR